jgi:hypothetical protein
VSGTDIKNMTFNEAEIAIFMNMRSLFQKITTSIIFTEIIEDIADVNDINIILENIEDAFLENIIIESAPVRRFTRYRKAIFKIIGANAVRANVIKINIMRAAEASIIFADEKESEKEDYLSKIIIAKSIITNENKLTYEER